MSGGSYHEPYRELSDRARNRHRALESLREEIEAIDWYDQRIEASDDPELRAILAHNRDEEKEHAAMLIEWLRRADETFDAMLRKHVFTEGPIAERESAPDGPPPGAALAVGSLKEEPGA